MAAEKQGKTLWEMLMERLHGTGGNGTGVAFENPLDYQVGSAVPVAWSNGPEFTNYDFTVQEIREYTRRIGAQEFRFTDYVLRGINTKSMDADDATTARLRVVPNQAGAHDSLLLRLYDEFKFAEDFLAVVKDDTGRFKVTDDKSGAEETFSRINDLRESYEAAVLVVSGTTSRGQRGARQSCAGENRVLGLLARRRNWRAQNRQGVHLCGNELRHRLVPDLAGPGIFFVRAAG
jgi:hypothetical protein